MAPVSTQIINAARQYLAKFLEGKEAAWETIHPRRKRWEFTYQHCLRVEHLVCTLLAAEKIALPEEDLLALRLAAILHDIGRLDCWDGHATFGVEVVAGWLQRPKD